MTSKITTLPHLPSQLNLRISGHTHSDEAIDLLLLDVALTEFAELQPGKSELVKLKFFGGLTIPEIAEIQQISVPTANRHWAFAKAWLTRRMNLPFET